MTEHKRLDIGDVIETPYGMFKVVDIERDNFGERGWVELSDYDD